MSGLVSIHERLFDDVKLSELITISLTRMRIDQLNSPEPQGRSRRTDCVI